MSMIHTAPFFEFLRTSPCQRSHTVRQIARRRAPSRHEAFAKKDIVFLGRGEDESAIQREEQPNCEVNSGIGYRVRKAMQYHTGVLVHAEKLNMDSLAICMPAQP